MEPLLLQPDTLQLKLNLYLYACNIAFIQVLHGNTSQFKPFSF